MKWCLPSKYIGEKLLIPNPRKFPPSKLTRHTVLEYQLVVQQYSKPHIYTSEKFRWIVIQTLQVPVCYKSTL